MATAFSRFAPRLQEAIVARLGWSSLRPVQEEAGHALLDGCNAVILAPTAGGKTEASMFPTLSALVSDPPEGLAAIYIAPIKALLNNQADRLGQYTEMVGLDRFVWHGDADQAGRKRFLKDPTALLMTTPESLEVMLVSQGVDDRALFADLRIVVIDEVHALAGTDRGAHLMSVLERLAVRSRHDIQRVGLSATVGNPSDILTWLQGTSKRPGRIVDPPKPPAPRELLVVHRETLPELARDAAKAARDNKALFFCQSRAATEAVAESMRLLGTEVFVHHSAVSKEERLYAEERFHGGGSACIVATSTLELGIDVGDLDKVLQTEAPDTVSSFLQRMGRTGRRAGQTANTTFYCLTTEGVAQAAALIELARAGFVESVAVTDRCWPVLVHQLFAMALAEGGVSADAAWTHLRRVPDFRGIHRAEFDRLVAWMIRDRSLLEFSGRLVLGPKAEKRFGRRNFMELFAVFSSPQSYAVQTTHGQPIGTLSQAFVDRLVDGVSSFLLGGRGWAVVSVRHDDRRVIVEPAPRGKQPSWGGFLPQFLGFELCQAMERVLASDTALPYLHPSAAEVLAARRAAFSGVLEPGVGAIEVDDDGIRWWTFAGGRINATLRYALHAVGGDWSIVPDNFGIRVRGEHLTERAFRDALDQLRDPEFWEDDKLWEEVATGLPNYRLSKFQPFVPPWIEREMLAEYLLDVEGAWRWLSGGGRALERTRLATGPRPGEAEAPPPPEIEPTGPRPTLPAVWVATEAHAVEACAMLAREPVIGLDVETTLRTRSLCLVQIAGRSAVYLFDALELSDLAPIAALLENPDTVKVIHNASFERSVFRQHDIDIVNVVDTLALSRSLRGTQPDGHGLKAVMARELGFEMDKTQQTSDWSRRPLSASQLDYAAVDAEVLLRLHDHLLIREAT
ncbi:MAG: DEAD/DEAH box helicase [Myxococcales bacterium]|nr:DEAD/DEAH box helicase [Myxococcales bacterium]